MSNLLRLFIGAGLFAAVIIVIAIGLATHTGSLMAPFNLLMFFLLMILYVAPTALALHRNCSATFWIATLNILLGWTFFGWAIALAWAATGKQSTHVPTIPSPPPAPSGPALQGR